MIDSDKTIFKRKIYSSLLEWKNNDSDKTALLIEGVRRVGKSTVVEQFAKNEFRSYLLIDFMKASNTVKELFSNHSDNPDRLFLLLSGYFNVRLYEHESLVIFDEVQEFPRAHQLVKYLVQYGKYPIVETGSLITLKMKTRMALPSEVRSVSMNPMDFEEFMWASGKEMLMEMVRDSFVNKSPLDDSLHSVLMENFRIYMITGGMPQSVAAFIETNDFSEVEKAKRMILDLYRNDIWREDDGILYDLFCSIPPMLNRVNKKFSPNIIKKGTKSNRYTKRIAWLCGSGMVNPCYNCANPDPAISQYEDRRNLKLYLVDTGLLLTMMLENNIGDRDMLYQSILRGNLSMNQGMLFENMAAQILVSTGRRLDFCLFKTEESNRLQEIDFIYADGRNVVPVEVKSRHIKPHKSLDRFVRKYGALVKEVYIICTLNLRYEPGITVLPIYMAGFI